MEEETEQDREYSKRETLKIETRKKGKEFVAKTNEVEYIIECPPPQDRPPDHRKKKHSHRHGTEEKIRQDKRS